MRFIELNRDSIIANSELKNGYYNFCIGHEVCVTVGKKMNVNSFLAGYVSQDITQDKYMMKYTPSNIIKFSTDVIDSDSALVSLDVNNGVTYISKASSGTVGGILAFSYLQSGNGIYCSNRRLYYNQRLVSTIKSNIKLLAVGLNNEVLVGLFYIPKLKGVRVGLSPDNNTVISPVNGVVDITLDFPYFTIDDWFKNAKVGY